MSDALPIFVIEDEKKMREILRINLSDKYNAFFYRDAESAMKEFSENTPDLIVTDVRLPGMDGIEFMEKVKKMDTGIPFIIFTGYGSIDHAVDSMKKGAFDYLTKPIKIENLIQSIERALSYIKVSKSTTELKSEFKVRIDKAEVEFITHDPSTVHMLNLALKASRFDSPILIAGETGTGKELVARFIHENSPRKGDFVKLNCASIPRDILEGELFGYKKGSFTGAVQDYDGKVALSDGGTLFLDEIGELPSEIQAKLLHILEIPEYYPLGSNTKRRVDLNLITATNRNLRKMVDEGQFRRDLYYRIAVIPITIPPLRERKCDIVPLASYFLNKMGNNYILSPEAKLKLLEYNWPGNVRELNNVVERSVLLAGSSNIVHEAVFEIDNYNSSDHAGVQLSKELPDTWEKFKKFKSKEVKNRRQELEKMFIEKLLIKNNGNISMCSRQAGIDRRQLQDMIKSLDIDVTLFRSRNGNRDNPSHNHSK
ncbi:MAG: sigma-54-dependent transcriptional regulator [Spirochaetota bacterium]